MPYSIFLDLDGTLLPGGERQFSDKTLKALTETQAAGHKIFLNTGRPASNLPVDSFRGFKFDGYLCGCTYVTVGGKLIMADHLSADESQPIVAHFYNRDTIVLLEGELAVYAAYDKENSTEKYGYIPLNDMSEIFKVCELEPISKISIWKKLSEKDVAFVQQFAHILRIEANCTEITPFGHDKAYVMNAVIDYLDLDPEKVIAMGDSGNDIAMLDAAPISVAMSTASEEVKSHAKYVTKSAKEDGVTVFLEEFLK